MDGDRKAWEVAAREAQYFEDDQEVKVEGPEVSLYLKGDQGMVSIRGEQGKLFLSGRDMDRAELEGALAAGGFVNPPDPCATPIP